MMDYEDELWEHWYKKVDTGGRMGAEIPYA